MLGLPKVPGLLDESSFVVRDLLIRSGHSRTNIRSSPTVLSVPNNLSVYKMFIFDKRRGPLKWILSERSRQESRERTHILSSLA